MSEREFEATISELFDEAPAAADETAFIAKLEARRAADARGRSLLLIGAGTIGAAVSTAALIVENVFTFTALVELPHQLLAAASSSWIAIVLLFAVCAGMMQRHETS